MRVVLELAGVKNAFGKQLGSPNPLNNARATVEGLSTLRTFKSVSEMRGIPVNVLMGLDNGGCGGGRAFLGRGRRGLPWGRTSRLCPFLGNGGQDFINCGSTFPVVPR